MRYLIVLAFFIFTLGTVHAQQPASDLTGFDPSAFLRQGKTYPKVMLVGTFHFDYPNLDTHVTDKEDQVDVKSEKRQAELRELIEYIAAFRPTKIIIERRKGSTINDRYREYLTNPDAKRGKGEVFQLAFPLAKRFGHDSLIIGDAFSLANSFYYNKDSATLRPIMEEIFSDKVTTKDTLMGHRYWKLYAQEDKLEAKSKLLDIFRYMNNPVRIKIGHGHYVQYMNDRDPDGLALNWYSRNLRIYNNIRKAATSPNDRILVLFGAGHLGILTQQLESDPSLDIVRFNEPENW